MYFTVININIRSPVWPLPKPRFPSRLRFLSWRSRTRFDSSSTNPFFFITRRLNFGRTLNTFPDPVSTKLEISRFGTTLGGLPLYYRCYVCAPKSMKRLQRCSTEKTSFALAASTAGWCARRSWKQSLLGIGVIFGTCLCTFRSGVGISLTL